MGFFVGSKIELIFSIGTFWATVVAVLAAAAVATASSTAAPALAIALATAQAAAGTAALAAALAAAASSVAATLDLTPATAMASTRELLLECQFARHHLWRWFKRLQCSSVA